MVAPIEEAERIAIEDLEKLFGRVYPWRRGWEGRGLEGDSYRVEDGHVVAMSIGSVAANLKLSWDPNRDNPIKPLETLPESIQNLKYLKHLSIYNQKFEDVPAAISNLESLTYLSFSNMKIKKLPQLGKLRKLETLLLRDTGIERIPPGLWNLLNLKRLNLSHNPLEEEDRILINQALSWGYWVEGEIHELGIIFLFPILYERETHDKWDATKVPLPHSWMEQLSRIKRGAKILSDPVTEIMDRGLNPLPNLLEEWLDYCIEGGDLKNAEKINQAFKGQEQLSNSYFSQLGKILVKQGRVPEAIEIFCRHFSRPFIDCADAYLSIQDWKNARNALEKVQWNDNMFAYRWGLVYYGLGLYDLAIDAFTTARDTWQSYHWNFYTPQKAQHYIDIITELLNKKVPTEPIKYKNGNQIFVNSYQLNPSKTSEQASRRFGDSNTFSTHRISHPSIIPTKITFSKNEHTEKIPPMATIFDKCSLCGGFVKDGICEGCSGKKCLKCGEMNWAVAKTCLNCKESLGS